MDRAADHRFRVGVSQIAKFLPDGNFRKTRTPFPVDSSQRLIEYGYRPTNKLPTFSLIPERVRRTKGVIQVMQLPSPHCLKAVELGIVDPEAVVPPEWLYDFCILCPATPEDCVGFFRQYGVTSEVDDNTYIALLAGGFFRGNLDALTIAQLLQKRFSKHLMIDEGMRCCLEKLTHPFTDAERAKQICLEAFTPYQEFADRLLADLPAPGEFSLGQ